MPAVSVVLPTYNRAWCLERAVRSVLAQDFQDWSLHIVDDGSDDGTPQLCDRMRSLVGPRLDVLRLERGGVSAARNAGAALGSSEWIAFLDSDDVWLPQKLGVQLVAAETSGAGLVYCDWFDFHDGGMGASSHRLPPTMVGDIYPHVMEVRCNVIVCPAVLLKRSAFEKVSGFDTSMAICEDIDLWRRVSRHERVAAVWEPLVGVHVRAAEGFAYASSLAGRRALYIRAAADDAALGPFMRVCYTELLDIYHQLALARDDGFEAAVIGRAAAELRNPNLSAEACHHLIDQLVDALKSILAASADHARRS